MSAAKATSAALPNLMSTAELQAARDRNAGLRLSLFIHGGLLAAFLIKCLVFPGQPVLYVPSLRVDLVGLPDMLKKDLQNVPKTPPSSRINEILKNAAEQAKNIKEEAPPPPKAAKAAPAPEEMAPKDEMVLKPKVVSPSAAAKPEHNVNRAKSLKSALDRIKAMSKIQGETEAPSRESPVVKGNKVSAGTTLSGEARENAEAGYLDIIRDRLQDNWELPVWISRQNLSAQAWVTIDPHGKVRSIRFEKASGNPQFDEAVKRAIQASSPFPPPPSGIAAGLLTNGILVGFPL